MPPKKGKKGKKSKKGKKKSGDPDDEEKKDENAEFKVELPKFGWIKIKVSQSAIISCRNGVEFVWCMRLSMPTHQIKL